MEKLAAFVPSGIAFTSGSAPKLPSKTTLLIAIIYVLY
jgi:hypothetical protein